MNTFTTYNSQKLKIYSIMMLRKVQESFAWNNNVSKVTVKQSCYAMQAPRGRGNI
jgi:hypothetical protein